MLKKILSFFILIFLFIQINSCKTEQPDQQSDKTRIILVNPSAWYLESLVYLTEDKIINIPNLEFQAVFYSKVKNRYEESWQYVKSTGVDFVKLTRISGELTEDNLFKENDLTDDFYRLFNNSAGILFLGGADIPPVVYLDKTNLLTGISTPNRHLFELSFLYHLLGRNVNDTTTAFLEENPEYVVYGFCLGMQTMNVANGGTMLQDIPSEIYGLTYVEDVLSSDKNTQHKNYWPNLSIDPALDYHSFHQIRFTDKGFFSERLKISTDNHPFVCSSHHQALKQIGKDFKIAATSLDGKVTEAIRHKKYPNVLGVQFHPEFSTLYNSNSQKYKWTPADTVLQTEYNYLVSHNSYTFHTNFWQYFSNLF